MCISVDLPDPDGPTTVTNSPASIVERNAAQRVNSDLADVIRLDQVPNRNQRHLA